MHEGGVRRRLARLCAAGSGACVETGSGLVLHARRAAGAFLLATFALLAFAPGAEAQDASQPTNLQLTVVSASEIDLTWTPPSSPGNNDRYFVDQRTIVSGIQPSFTNIANILNISTSMYRVTGLSVGTTYDFRLTACPQPPASCDLSALGQTITHTHTGPPGKPRNLTATRGSGDQYTLDWDAPSNNGGANITGYKVRYRERGTGPWTEFSNLVTTVPRTTTSPAFSGKAWDFQVAAVNANGTGPYSDTAILAGPPGAPTNLRYDTLTNASQDPLRWNAPSDNGGGDITDYHYQRREIGTSAWGAPRSTGSTAVTDNANKPNDGAHTGYEYQVRAVNSAGAGGWSNTVAIAGRPNNLGDLTLTPATDRVAVTVSWSAPSDDGGKPITQYVVQWRPDSDNNWSTDGHTGETVVTSGTSVTVSAGLAPNTIYNFRYRAHNEDRSSFHHPGAGEFEAMTAAGDPPAAPVLTATAHATQNDRAELSWTVPDDGGSAITGYRWEARPVGTSTWPLSGGPSTPTGTTVVVGTLSTSDASEFRVFAINAAGDSPPSNIETVAAPPGAPAGLRAAEVRGERITIQWSAPSNTGGKPVTEYTYQWGPDDGGATWPNERTTTSTSASLAPLSTGTDYQYRVKARNADREGAFTARATATTLATPAAVTGVTATGGAGSITVTWNAADGADGYVVTWGKSGETRDPGDRRELGGSTTRTVIDGLEGETEYSVSVTATNAAGNSPVTADSTARATTEATDARISATGPSPLTEANLNGARLTVDLLNTEWASSLSTGQFTPSGVPGVSVRNVSRDTDSRATVTLDFDDTDSATDFDADRTLRLSIAASAHAGSEPFTATVGVGAVVESPPGQVQTVTLAAGPQRIDVSWDAVDGADGYRVRWTPTAGPGNAGVATGGTRRRITGLAPNTQYTVTVTATKTRAPDGPASAGRTATTPAFRATISATEPSPLTEGNLGQGVLVVDLEGAEWNNVTTSRHLFRLSGVPGVFVDSSRLGHTVGGGVENVSPSRVKVYLGYSGTDFDTDATLKLEIFEDAHTWTEGATLTVPVSAVVEQTPGRMTGVTARGGAGLVVVEWDRLDGATGYRVQWKGPGEEYNTNRQGTTGRTFYTITGLEANTQYTARVRAITNKAPAEGEWSADRTATTTGETVTEPVTPRDDVTDVGDGNTDTGGNGGSTGTGGNGSTGGGGGGGGGSSGGGGGSEPDTLEPALAVTVAPGALRIAAVDDPATGDTDERQATYTITLTRRPTGTVTITPQSSDPAIAAVTGPLTFTRSDWDTPQTLTVTGAADGRVGIDHRISGGGYNNVAVPEVTVTVGDGGADPRKTLAPPPCTSCEEDMSAGPQQDPVNTGQQAGADGQASTDTAAGSDTTGATDVPVSQTERPNPNTISNAGGQAEQPGMNDTGDTDVLDAQTSLTDNDGADTNTNSPAPALPDGALAALAQGHLTSARQVLGARLNPDADAGAQLTLAGQTLSLAQLLTPGAAGTAFDFDLDHPPLATGLSWDQATGRCAAWYTASCAGFESDGLGNPLPGQQRAGPWDTLFYRLTTGLLQGTTGDALWRGSEFALTLGGGDEPGAPGRRWTLWGRGHVQALAGLPAGVADGTDLRSGYLGIDTHLGANARAGFALSRSLSAGTLTTVHPYLTWSDGATTLSAFGGIGRGNTDPVSPAQDHPYAAYDALTDRPLGLRMGLVEVQRQLGMLGSLTLDVRGDAAWAQLSADNGIETQTETVRTLRLGAGAKGQWQVGRLTLAPTLETHLRHDTGHGPTGRGLELLGGLAASHGDLRLTVQGRMLTTRSEAAYRERGLQTTLSLGQPGQLGPSLSLSARWGDAATGGDTLWQEQLHYRHGTTGLTRNNAWSLDARSEVGLILAGGRLLTGFASFSHAGDGPRALVGLRLGLGAVPLAQ